MPPLPPSDLDDICRQTRALWDEARGSHIFLTGGTGFFGSWLVESFLRANQRFQLEARLTVLTRSPGAFLRKCPHLSGAPGLILVPGDVRTFPYPDGDYPFVIHAATEAASSRQAADEPLQSFSTLVDGTRRTLDFAVARGARRFLLTSSGAVYGKQPPEISHVPETYQGRPHALDPASVYGEGKVISEHLCALYQKVYGLDTAIARCWAFTGAHLPLDQHFAIGNFIGDVIAGRSLRIVGDGTPTRSYLYASDLAVWLWTLLFRGSPLQPYNVGSGEAVTIRELAETVARVLHPGAPIDIARRPVPGAARSQYVPDVSFAERGLGLRVTVPLPEAIRRTAEWYGYRCAQ
jgi:nucleoside-diphosphate-sugar epimerase